MYTAAQQAKIDAAQKRLDNAKSSYSTNVTRYNDWVASIQGCYKDQIQNAGNASTWYNPTIGPCTAAGSCSLSNCKNGVNKLNDDVIPALRAAYTELNSAQSNFDKVLNEITTEVQNDPAITIGVQTAGAQIEADAKVRRTRIIIIGIVVIVIIGAFIWYKYIRK